jgi:hypothetical protein
MEVILAFSWSTLAFTLYIIPEEIIRTEDWAANTGANCFIPNLIGVTLLWMANATTNF